MVTYILSDSSEDELPQASTSKAASTLGKRKASSSSSSTSSKNASPAAISASVPPLVTVPKTASDTNKRRRIMSVDKSGHEHVHAVGSSKKKTVLRDTPEATPEPVASTSKVSAEKSPSKPLLAVPKSMRPKAKPTQSKTGETLHVRTSKPSPAPSAKAKARPNVSRLREQEKEFQLPTFTGRNWRDRKPYDAPPSLASLLSSRSNTPVISKEPSRENSVVQKPAEVVAQEPMDTNETGQVLDSEVIDVVSKKAGEPKVITKAVKKRTNKVDSNRWSQTGPEREGEFDKHLQKHMNASTSDRKDKMRATVFEAMVYETNLREEPFAPPVTVIPHPAETAPEFNFIYTSRVVYPKNVNTLQSLGCTCTDGCKPGDSCACYKRQCEENAKYDHPPGFAYDQKGLLKFKHDEPMAIWECNDMCGCPPECQNRVMGNGRNVPIDLYRTPECGWGARLGELKRKDPNKEGKIKAGTFVGVYSGELVSTNDAKKRDQLYNTINLSYLFDLDFRSIGNNQHLKAFDEEGIAFIGASGSGPPIAAEVVQAPAGLTITHGDDPNGKPLNLVTATDQEKQDALNDFEAFHSVDAYHYGNHTRFMNHSCQPNCILRCGYVNEGDPTKPLLAIFTVKTVRSYEPLTISYAGQIDLEEDEEIEVLNMPVAAAVARGKSKGKKPKKEPKVIEDSKRTCFCGAPRCSGRMFRDADMSDEEETKAPDATLPPIQPPLIAALVAHTV